MPLLFNTLLDQAQISPASVRLLRHQDRRLPRNRTPFEMWRDDRAAFEAYQSHQSFGNRSKLRAEYWASFVVTPAGETLLAGFYACRYQGTNNTDLTWSGTNEVTPAETCDVYSLMLDQHLSDFSGRLVIDWGGGERAWIQRADSQNKHVREIRQVYKDPDFPGYSNFISDLSAIEGLPPSWAAALSASRGVYLLTCPRTREQYIGSASGTSGFYGRWQSYARNGHGDNVGLKSRDPSDYQVSILEVAGSASTWEDIMSMESLWKQKFRSREMGLNRN